MLLCVRLFKHYLSYLNNNIYSHIYESIEKAAAQYFINLSRKSSDADNDVIKLRDLLYQSYDKVEFESKYQTSINQFDSLKKHFSDYENTISNISKDSALVLFNQWYLHFSNTFYNYADEKFFSSNKTKILFFSASMSCYCTLEMCKNQLIDILNFVKENDKQFDYWIVDSYEHNELQLKYETFFAPSVLVLNKNNELLYKIEYDEKMLEHLTMFLNGYKG